MTKPNNWEVHFARLNEANFILDTWYREQQETALHFTSMTPSTISAYMPRRVRLLFSAFPCAVAATPKQPIGFTCYGFERSSFKPIVHAIYVLPKFRRSGVGTALLAAAGVGDGTDGWHTSFVKSNHWPRAARNLQQNSVLLDYAHQAPGYPP